MRYKMPMLLSSILSLTMLSGCETATTESGVRTISDFCLIAKGIGYAAKPDAATETLANIYDTPETVAAVEEHNLKYQRTCPEG